MSELLCPFAHLEKELSGDAALQPDPEHLSKEAVQDSIARLLMDVEDSLSRHALLDYTLKTTLKEVGVQTDNDPITDEAPEYAARPPPCKKLEMIPDMNVFEEIDKHALEVSIVHSFESGKMYIYVISLLLAGIFLHFW